MLPVVALWLFTLGAIYLALRHAGVYGLVADAQNLIAIFGVLHVTASAIEARAAARQPASQRIGLRRNRRACSGMSPAPGAYPRSPGN
jgi:hypothetical protein